MKDIKLAEDIYIEEYDIHVHPFLTLEQVQNIINEVMKYSTYSEREEVISHMLLIYSTDMTDEQIESIGIEMAVSSGLIAAVRYYVSNLQMVYEGLNYHESVGKAIQSIAKAFNKMDTNELMTAIKEVASTNGIKDIHG